MSQAGIPWDPVRNADPHLAQTYGMRVYILKEPRWLLCAWKFEKHWVRP